MSVLYCSLVEVKSALARGLIDAVTKNADGRTLEEIFEECAYEAADQIHAFCSAYTLPFDAHPDTPGPINWAAKRLTIANLVARLPSMSQEWEIHTKRADEVREWLRRVADGKVTIPGVTLSTDGEATLIMTNNDENNYVFVDHNQDGGQPLAGLVNRPTRQSWNS